MTEADLIAEVAELHHLLSVAAEVARERAEKLVQLEELTVTPLKLDRDNHLCHAELDLTRERLAKYETAFAGFYFVLDGYGKPVLFKRASRIVTHQDIQRPDAPELWNALLAVLPTEAPE